MKRISLAVHWKHAISIWPYAKPVARSSLGSLDQTSGEGAKAQILGTSTRMTRERLDLFCSNFAHLLCSMHPQRRRVAGLWSRDQMLCVRGLRHIFGSPRAVAHPGIWWVLVVISITALLLNVVVYVVFVPRCQCNSNGNTCDEQCGWLTVSLCHNYHHGYG